MLVDLVTHAARFVGAEDEDDFEEGAGKHMQKRKRVEYIWRCCILIAKWLCGGVVFLGRLIMFVGLVAGCVQMIAIKFKDSLFCPVLTAGLHVFLINNYNICLKREINDYGVY